jgi:hypothetical protein
MVSHELTKELGHAGFPFDHQWVGSERRCTKCGQFEDRHPEFCYPTLPELIDACGDDFEVLGNEETAQGREWVAISFHSHCYARGLEPEEAVARLWLILHANTQAGSA